MLQGWNAILKFLYLCEPSTKNGFVWCVTDGAVFGGMRSDTNIITQNSTFGYDFKCGSKCQHNVFADREVIELQTYVVTYGGVSAMQSSGVCIELKHLLTIC